MSKGRTVVRAAGWLACAALLLAAGCARQAKGPPPIPGVTPAPAGLKFSVTVRPRRVTLGQRVHMEASMFNDSEKSFHKSFDTGCAWDYEVMDENGVVVGPVHTCADSARAEIDLAPGELRMIVREWKGHDYFNGPSAVGPGRYKIVAGLVDRDLHVVPMSEPVWLEIDPRSR